MLSLIIWAFQCASIITFNYNILDNAKEGGILWSVDVMVDLDGLV